MEAFAKFFKQYMSVSSIVAASLPIPVAAAQLIPSYKAHQKFLATYASLFCFLSLAFIFYSRHHLARWMFGSPARRRGWPQLFFTALPLVFIGISLSSVFAYHAVLERSVLDVQGSMLNRGIPAHSMTKILADTDMLDIARSTALVGLYLAIFISAETAFILMALREYLQDILKFSEETLIYGESSRTTVSS